jgi:ribonuclease-3
MNKIEEIIGYNFKNKNLLKTALTHSSYSNENNGENNERLEFLGDAVLDLIISNYLYRNYKNFKEGDMTKKRAQIVCEHSLVHFSKKINLQSYILLGNGVEHCIQESIIADAFEALLGAVYLDSSLQEVTKIVDKLVIPYINELTDVKDYKSTLQEYVQADKRSLSYQIIKEEGPSHNKEFTAICQMDGIIMGQGVGKSKREAEQNAACEALKKLSKL